MKLIKFLFGLLIGLLIVVLVIVVFLCIMILDFNVVEPDYLKNETSMELSTETTISRALSYAKTNSKINFYLSEKELNVLLKESTKEINEALSPISGRIEALYVDLINESDVKYYCYFSFYGVTSSIKGEFEYREGIDSLSFSFSNFNIGSLNLKTSLFQNLSVSGQSINDYLLEQMKDTDFRAYFADNGAFNISINNNFVQSFLLDAVKEQNNSLFNPIINNILFSTKSINFGDEQFNFGIDISDFGIDYTKDFSNTKYYTCELAQVDVEELLNNGLIKQDDASLVATFLMSGYDVLNDEEKSRIDEIDFSSVGILDNTDYDGLVEYDKRSISEVLISEITAENAICISESSISSLLLKEGIVGQMYCFVRNDNDRYSVSFIGIEDMYVDINLNCFDFYFNISINGFVMPLVISTNQVSSNGLRTVHNINNIRLGSSSFDNDKKEMIDYLASVITIDWFTFDATNSQIIIDFTNEFSSNLELNALLAINPDLSISLVGDKTSGFIKIS